MASPLGERIKALVAATGPMSVSQFFSLCLADPDHGYYRTHEPFGREGDFVTAPEISQLFGEMVGIFLVGAWQVHGMPAPVRLVEFGPGRGTMMSDILRVVAQLAPQLQATATVHLIEMSDRLAAVQARTLGAYADRISWHTALADVPPGFTMIVANEFFDALPIRQYVKTTSGFRERVIGLDEVGELAFRIGTGRLEPASLPEGAASVPEGTIMEVAPGRTAVMQDIAGRLMAAGGVALAIDYGHLTSGFGDTLQALKAHRPDPPLASPGEADLTSHVDFAALARAAEVAGATVVGSGCQGDFLLGLGLIERAGRLGAGKDTTRQEAIREAVERLAAPGAGRMGELFKVLAVGYPGLALPPFRATD